MVKLLKYKIIIAGAKDVGKSSLISRFCDNIFKEDMKATIGVDFKRKIVTVKGAHKDISLELNIWDFAGEEKYRTLFPAYANGASAAFILFDTTNKDSLEDIDNWIKIIDENAFSNIVKHIIATKIDLKNERRVSKKEATNFCKKYDWCEEITSTSSKTGENVEEAFIYVIKKVIKRNLQTCKTCGEIFNKELKNCQYCGAKVEIEISPI
ncbi:MAG: Rab family GTPase [Candidatus Hermodarchaeota archaeon]